MLLLDLQLAIKDWMRVLNEDFENTVVVVVAVETFLSTVDYNSIVQTKKKKMTIVLKTQEVHYNKKRIDAGEEGVVVVKKMTV